MHLSKPLYSLAATLLLSLPSALAQNWTSTDVPTTINGPGIGAAPGWFVFVLTNAKDSPTNEATLSLWTETSPRANVQTINCTDASEPWYAFADNDLPYPIGLHRSAKWCGGSNSDGLWLSYYDRFQVDVSTSGVCGYFYQGSKLSWICYLEANPDKKKYGC